METLYKTVSDAQKVRLWEENVKYLLDSCPEAIRMRYKGGEEDLIDSLCVTFIKLRDGIK